MPSRSPSRGRDRSPTRSPTPRSAYSRSPSRRRHYDSRSPSRSPTPPTRRNSRYRSESRSWSRGRGRDISREPSDEPLARSTKVGPARILIPSAYIGLTCRAQIVVERLSKNINEEHLYEIFGEFGPIKDLDLPINRTCEPRPPIDQLNLTWGILPLTRADMQLEPIEGRRISFSTTRQTQRPPLLTCMRPKSMARPLMFLSSYPEGSFRLLPPLPGGVPTSIPEYHSQVGAEAARTGPFPVAQ